MTRVAVIGNAGGGKSTLCRAISDALGLPYHSIDKIQWLPGWEMMPEAEFHIRHESLIAGERWIIDGFGPWQDIERRFDAADTIVFIDLPLWRHLLWATKRQIRSVFLGRTDGPEGCPMWQVTFKLYRMMWWLHRKVRPKLIAAMDAYRADRDIIHLRSPRDIEGFRKACLKLQPHH
ncbi:flagellar protein FlaR [Denitrobaculum tricleocarpae]|uniref:Flagellar protein FlaR n=1 Tax=Denitrobaculum tricleocarpae TaxID=2591009 RepID=A0A545TWT7_9PROT|nr:flagellar protein FlaR [Denitrobaculum tricleocarpae]TQV81683.1 flagellar protein FlaR [Denitrobaculum tricleocarpae]